MNPNNPKNRPYGARWDPVDPLGNYNNQPGTDFFGFDEFGVPKKSPFKGGNNRGGKGGFNGGFGGGFNGGFGGGFGGSGMGGNGFGFP